MSDKQILEDRQNLARMARRLNARGRGRRVAGLVLMTDDSIAADWVEAIDALPRGSAVIVRHRDRTLRTKLARQLRTHCRRRGIQLLVSDDHLLALQIGADGIHVPECAASRIPGFRRMKRGWMVSMSAHAADSIARSNHHKPDLLLVSPLFATGSHPGARALGTARLAALAVASRVPVHALGGIDGARVAHTANLPIQGIALIRGWVVQARGKKS